MLQLAEQQTLFAEFLRSGDATLLAGQIAEAGPSMQIRLGVYRQNMLGNLAAVLRLAYPAVLRVVGAAAFNKAAQEFIQIRSPKTANLYEYDEYFSIHLNQSMLSRQHPALADIARLDWAVHRALHATRHPALALEGLSQIDLTKITNLYFTAHPSLTLLTVGPMARAGWEAALLGNHLPPAPRAEHLAVFCHLGKLKMATLHGEAFDFARMLVSGFPLGTALDVVVPDEAATILCKFLNLGIFSAASITQPNIGGLL